MLLLLRNYGPLMYALGVVHTSGCAAVLVTLNNTCRLLLALAGRCLHTRCPARADKPFGGSTLRRCPACQCWRRVAG